MLNDKHAYLIITHNEFEILKLLISALDDVRNDVYVHIDKKVKHLPNLSVKKSRLFVIDKRIDVRWGHVSQIKSELLLFERALKNGPYAFYHLISGTHLPLENQDFIHSFFQKYYNKNVFCNLKRKYGDYSEILKLHRINLFLRYYASPNVLLSRTSQFLWKLFIAIQRELGIIINDNKDAYWANNWCSLSHDAVKYIVDNKKNIINRYRWSFCGDEFFIPTELSKNACCVMERCDLLLFGIIERSNARVIEMSDYERMINSGCLFARKFSVSNNDVVEAVIHKII